MMFECIKKNSGSATRLGFFCSKTLANKVELESNVKKEQHHHIQKHDMEVWKVINIP